MVACGSLPWLQSVTFDCLARRISESCPPPDSPQRCPLSPSTAFCWLRQLPVVLQGAPRHDSWKIIHCYRGTTWRREGAQQRYNYRLSTSLSTPWFPNYDSHDPCVTQPRNPNGVGVLNIVGKVSSLSTENTMCFIGVLHNRSMQIVSNCELEWKWPNTKSYKYLMSIFQCE